jgi:hypothetical protein
VSIDRQAFRELLRPLCTMFRANFGVSEWTVYYQALSDVSAVLLQDAIVLASRDDSRSFMPRPGELRGYAETARLTRLAATPWQPCVQCAPFRGFIEVTVDGVKRMGNCPCRAAHRSALEAQGVPPRPLVDAVAERSDAEAWAQIAAAPDPRQLPPGVAPKVKSIAGAHRMPSAGQSLQTDVDGEPLR